MNKKKILLTGSEGSLMQALVPKLIEKYDIIGIDNFSRYGLIERDRNYRFIDGDLTDVNVIEKVFSENQFNYVIQAAALIYGVGGFHKYPVQMLRENLQIHNNILEFCVKHSVEKVVYISSSMVYERCKKHPSKEEDAFEATTPSTEYGLGKLVGEKLSIAYKKQFDLDYTIWRPFNIVSPYEKAEEEQGVSHVFADFIDNIVVKQINTLPIIGDGNQIRCFTWVDDIALAIANFSFDFRADNQIFNIGNPEPFTMKEFANLIHKKAIEYKLIDGKLKLKFETTKNYTDDVLKRIPDISKIKTVFGWQPAKNVEAMVVECLKQFP